MLTFILLIILAIIIYFVVKQLLHQRNVIYELRNELTRLNELQNSVNKQE
ncbi:MAG: hypothetical protein HQK68_08045 [Desulfamplus sp.]|nr:hypothetical protein [Desulfamplus sp.]